MSGPEPAPPGGPDRDRRCAHRGGRVVISSVTGEPIAWEDTGPTRRGGGEGAPVIPDRMRDEQPEPGADESNDARLARDVPPHWGTGA